jgi:hypothetical protein
MPVLDRLKVKIRCSLVPRNPTPLLACRSPASSVVGLLGPSDTCGRDQYRCKVPVDRRALCQGFDSGWNVTGKRQRTGTIAYPCTILRNQAEVSFIGGCVLSHQLSGDHDV